MVTWGGGLGISDKKFAWQLPDEPFHFQAEQRHGHGRTRQAAVADHFVNTDFLMIQRAIDLLFVSGEFERGQNAGLARAGQAVGGGE